MWGFSFVGKLLYNPGMHHGLQSARYVCIDRKWTIQKFGALAAVVAKNLPFFFFFGRTICGKDQNIEYLMSLLTNPFETSDTNLEHVEVIFNYLVEVRDLSVLGRPKVNYIFTVEKGRLSSS